MTNKSEGMKGLNDAALIAELLGSTVFEKCEYVWSAPYSAEESRESCLPRECSFPIEDKKFVFSEK